jgi:hypothetical protein
VLFPNRAVWLIGRLLVRLRSTLQCVECDNTAVRFDPFLMMSLPLAGAALRTVPVHFFDNRGSRPLLVPVPVNDRGTIGLLKERLAESTFALSCPLSPNLFWFLAVLNEARAAAKAARTGSEGDSKGDSKSSDVIAPAGAN